jgi:hypothetical protein
MVGSFTDGAVVVGIVNFKIVYGIWRYVKLAGQALRYKWPE